MSDGSALPGAPSLAVESSASLWELAAFFLRLGMAAFGGPAAHIAIMEDELVRRRQWLSREKFLDLLSASNLIPGPSSSELAIHIGYLRAGWQGLLVAGFCFILPAAAMVGVLAWAYVHFGRLPAVSSVLYGVKPVVIAVILQALWGLARAAIKTRVLGVLGIICVGLSALELHPLLLLLLAGIAAMFVQAVRSREKTNSSAASGRSKLVGLLSSSAGSLGASATGLAAPFSLVSLFLVFLKVGAVVFGSGYVLLAFLRADLVVQRHWITDSQLLDSIAIGQVTPGPVFTTATFIGYLLGGFRGSVVATVAIFLPAFLLVAASGPLIPRIRKSKIAGAFLDGVNVGSLALMAVVTWQLGRSSLTDMFTVSLAIASFAALLIFRLNSVWLILAGGFAGLLAQHFH